MNTRSDLSGMPGLSADRGLFEGRREIWAETLRIVASGVWLPWILIRHPEAVRLWAPMFSIPVVSALAMLAVRWDLFPRQRRLIVALLDIALLTYVVWGLGSSTTPIIVFFVMTVIIATMSSSPRVGLAVTVGVIVSYGTVLLLEARGIVPQAPLAHAGIGPHEAAGGRPLAFMSISLSAMAAYAFLLHVRRRMEQSAEREHELRLAEQTAQQKAIELQRQLELAQRMESLGRLAGGVAHDFNNLLTIIHGAFAFACAETDRSDIHEALEDGQTAARKASNLTQQLLAFSRRQSVRPQLIDPGQLIARTRRMLERVIGEGIAVEIDLASELGPIKVDPTQLEQVLINLAINSRDAMPKGGRLTILARNRDLGPAECEAPLGLVPGAYVEIAVADTGHGMDEETLRRAVEPFFTTKPQGRGTGLGLSTVFGILQQNKGAMQLSSKIGAGTMVRLLLPRIEGIPAQLTSGRPAAAPGKETVLLVEDEGSLRRMARRALERYGYTVLEADCGEAALACAGRHGAGIDLLVTDLVMPGITGKALADQMRKARPGLKVLYVSGYSPEALDQEALLANGAQFLPKPFEPDQLSAHVRAVLDQK